MLPHFDNLRLKFMRHLVISINMVLIFMIQTMIIYLNPPPPLICFTQISVIWFNIFGVWFVQGVGAPNSYRIRFDANE